MKKDLLALVVVVLVAVVFPSSLFAYQASRSNLTGVRVIDLVGHSPANGGWQPDVIRVNLGERIRLRISSVDVVHGLAIPALGLRADEILPGHVEEVEFTASQAGTFEFACTRWCSVDHWRMRGRIEVVDPSGQSTPTTSAPPLYQQMQIDIDAAHPAANIPAEPPSAGRGAVLELIVNADLRTTSPSAVWAKLRADAAFGRYTDQELWDAIAFAYERMAGDAAIARGEALYAQDCAACHGETGKGNGTAGRNLPGLAAMQVKPAMPPSGLGGIASSPAPVAPKRGPADLTDGPQMLGASDVLLEGKIVRGGMGTGMPEWGSLYTEQDLRDVIAYIRSFTFSYRSK